MIILDIFRSSFGDELAQPLPERRGLSLVWLLAFTKSFARAWLVCRVVGCSQGTQPLV